MLKCLWSSGEDKGLAIGESIGSNPAKNVFYYNLKKKI